MKKLGMVFALLLGLLTLSMDAFAVTEGSYDFSEVSSAWDGTYGDRTKEPSAIYNYTYGDEDSLSYTLPWPFSFYGVTYNSIKVDTNGNIWFSDAANGPAHSFDLARTHRGPVIAAWNNDLSSYYYGGVFIQHKDFPERVVIEWLTETYSDEGYYKPNNFEVVLYRNGNFRIDYNSFAADVSGMVSGISKDDEQPDFLSLSGQRAGTSFAFSDIAPPYVGVDEGTILTKESTATLRGTREENATISIVADTSATIGAINYPDATTWNCTVTALAEGANKFTITASDLIQKTATVNATVTRDSIPPNVSASPSGGAYTGPQTVQLTSTESGMIYYTLDDSEPTTTSSVYSDPLSITPPKTLKFFATDLAGNASGVDAEFYKVGYTVDASAGNGGAITPATDTIESGGSATLTITPDTGYRFDTLTDNGVDVTSNVTGNSYSINNITGNHAVAATFADIAPPLLTLSTLATGSYIKDDVLNIAGRATDNIGVSELRVNSFVVPLSADGSYSYAYLLSNGANHIHITAKDLAGNEVSAARSINFDPAAPNLVISAPADNSRTASVLTTISGTMDENSTVTARLGGNVQAAAVSGTNFSANLTFDPGVNTIEVTATDLAGKINTQKRTVVYDNQKPDLAITSPSQDLRTSQSSIAIAGTATDPGSNVTVSIAVDGQTYTPAVVNGQFEQVITFSTEKKYTLLITATNEAGAVSSLQREVIYTSFEQGSILMNGGAVATNSSVATLTLLASSGSSAVTQMQFSKDGGATWSNLEPYAATRTLSLAPAGDGVKTVAVRYKNALGKVSTPYSAAITVSTVPPSGSIVINGGAAYAASVSVVATLSASSPNGVSQMQFSKDDGATWTGWETYATTRNLTLAPAGDGEKRIRVRFKDTLGNVSSAVIEDSIILHTSLPSCGIVINNGAPYAQSSIATLALSSISTIGVTHMQFSKDGGATWYGWEPYATARTVTLTPAGDGPKTVSAKFKDSAGKVSSACSDSITVSATPPTDCSIQINGIMVDGKKVTGSSTATLALSATSPIPISQMKFSYDGGNNWEPWQAYAASTTIPLMPPGDGDKSVSVRYMDAAEKVSSCMATDTITLDSTPVTGSIQIEGGAALTNKTAVALSLSAASPVGITHMQFSKDQGSTWVSWEPFATARTLTLVPEGDGLKWVSVRFKDAEGNTSGVYPASITKDTTPPTGTIMINSGAASTASPYVTLTLSASDSNGVTEMQFSKDNVSWYGWEAFATSRSATLLLPDAGVKYFYVRFKDSAGNVSTAYSDTIEYAP